MEMLLTGDKEPKDEGPLISKTMMWNVSVIQLAVAVLAPGTHSKGTTAA